MDRLSVEPQALFVYGSLLFPEVLRTLIDRVPESSPAAVEGWRIAALPNRVYPVLVPAEAIAHGRLITDLNPAEWRTIDAFEDRVYELRRLNLTDSRYGWAYATEDVTSALPEDWDKEVFATRELSTYIVRCSAWRTRYEASQS
ncbi:gamma-glutamylcyclotransferase [Streptosporangiaceae bacterium NEAU-GS5]|nr:gamma-glutamylcyclotransferase [Streptosporangiaceae bacterium NEAU-GS5]